MKEDLNEIKQWGTIMQLSSRCGLGQFSANTLIMAIDKFEDYFQADAHVKAYRKLEEE